MRSFASFLLALSLPLYAFATHGVNLHRHADLAARLQGGSGDHNRFSFYDITVGTTACGHTHSASDFVVALDAALFGNTPGSSAYCGKSITISYNGKSTGAVIDDKCPGCPPGGLDLTSGLFQFFEPLGTGIIYGSWSLAGEEAPAEAAPAPAPATTSTPPPPPTTTYHPPTTTEQQTTSSPPSSSSSSTATTSKAPSSVSSAASASHQPSSMSNPSQTPSAVNYNNPLASSLAQPSGTISPGENTSINSVYQAVIGLGSLCMALHP